MGTSTPSPSGPRLADPQRECRLAEKDEHDRKWRAERDAGSRGEHEESSHGIARGLGMQPRCKGQQRLDERMHEQHERTGERNRE
jgi:hypothetical protein